MTSAILHRNLTAPLPVVVKGAGAWLYDADGKAYLDASGGAAVSCLGHSHPRVIEAVRHQVGVLPFAHTSFFTNEPAERLAERLVGLAPDGFCAGRVMFVGSGSEAMEGALKLARQHHVEAGRTGRVRFIARRMSYHGNTLGALAVGGNLGRRELYGPMLMEVSHVSPCYAYRNQQPGEDADAYGTRLAAELAREIERLGPDTVAAFVAEPVVGATLGTVPPVPGYLRKIREVCDRYGVLLIADEVMCGMGRCGDWFTSAQEGVAPDLITIAKGLGAGYQPIGAVLAGERVMAPLIAGSGTLAHGHTYMSHAVGCAASLAVMDAIEEDALLPAVNRLGASLEAGLRKAFGGHPNVGDIRGRGLFWSLELVKDRARKAPFDAGLGLAAKVKAAAMAEGLICYPSSGTADGRNGDHVLLAPPFICTEGEIEEITAKLSAAIAQALAAIAVPA